MVYYDKMVASLKIGNKFLRDKDSVIKLPFNSEYSLFLKNMESRDAVVKISIDGEDILDNSQIIIKGNSSLELEGLMKDRVVKNKFKFIELTKEVEDYRGLKSEDSLIRIEFRFQKPKPIIQEVITTFPDYRPYWQPYRYVIPYWYYNPITNCYDVYSTTTTTSYNLANVSYTINASSLVSNTTPVADSLNNDLGITVRGAETNQNFGIGYIGELEDISHVIVLRLSGYKTNDSKIESIVTTDSKIECTSCGMVSNSSYKYCPRCGTYLS